MSLVYIVQGLATVIVSWTAGGGSARHCHRDNSEQEEKLSRNIPTGREVPINLHVMREHCSPLRRAICRRLYGLLLANGGRRPGAALTVGGW